MSLRQSSRIFVNIHNIEISGSHTFDGENGSKWWPGMSRTRTEHPTRVSHLATASRGLLRSLSHFGILGKLLEEIPSFDLRRTTGGNGPSPGSGLYVPRSFVLERNCNRICLAMSDPAACLFALARLSIRLSSSGTWSMGLGESIRRTRASTPFLTSCRAISKANTPPKDHPRCFGQSAGK